MSNSMYYALLTILGLLFSLFAWKNFRGALILFSGLLPVYLLRLSIGPLPTTLLEILLLILIGVWLIKHRSSWKEIRIIPWLKPAALFIIASGIGTLIATDTASALGIWKAYFIEPILLAIVFTTTLKRGEWPSVFKAIGVTAAILSIFAIIQYVTGFGIPTPWDIELRVTSLFDYPNALGLFLAPMLSYGLVQYAQKKDRAFWAGISALSFIAILLSRTEAALVAIPAALFIAMLLSPLSIKIKNVLTASTLLTATLAIALIPTVQEKLLLQDYSGLVRQSQWTETSLLVQDHLLLGVGLNSYPAALAPYHNATQYEIFQYPHNIFLNVWTELGILGLIAFFWLAWLVFKNVRTRQLNNSLTLAIFTALLTMTIHGLVDVPYFKNDLSVLTWIFIAAFFATRSTAKS
jgi:putative inorganic carbon (hco3(-)) transporter